jgi:hypothetical protein
MNAIQRMQSGVLIGVASALVACSSPETPPSGRTFASAEDAVKALTETVKERDVATLVAIFGPDGKELIESSDPATASRNREVFAAAAGESWRLVDDGANRKTLVVGNEGWPFPVPLVRQGDRWHFDTAAGKEEVLARRIGKNEIAAIAICRRYVEAQRRYALEPHDGKRAGLYAQRFRSDDGKQNGLFWRSAKGQLRSPLGEMVAFAEDDPSLSRRDGEPTPFYGYLFRIVTAQGPAAKGGAMDYLVDGELARGFALVAWPAEYDVTGVMTFVVSDEGRVYERDLGPGTAVAVRALRAYDPDQSWSALP